jgi:hypothetical protein
LHLNLIEDKKDFERIHAVGGSFALIQLVKNCLDKAIDKIPACDQVTKLSALPNLKTSRKALRVIICLTCHHEKFRVGISLVGGVEAIVKVMRMFKKCLERQRPACGTLRNLTSCNLGKKKAVETGAMEFLVAAVNNNLGSAYLCDRACWALSNIVEESKENTRLLISLGGGATVSNVRKEWPDDDEVQIGVQDLAKSIGTEMSSWAVMK